MAGNSAGVSESVKEFISEIISKHDLNATSDVIYHPGSAAGDGYLSRTHAITINIENGDPWELFVKEALHIASNSGVIPLEKLYANEIHFYENIYPAYLNFTNEKGAKSYLRYVPKCYATSPANIVALENLRTKGFEIFDCNNTMNDEHIELVFKKLAELHAISFAYKDQKRTEFEKLIENRSNVVEYQGNENFDGMRKGWIDEFIETLDPKEDKLILIKLDNLGDRLNCYFRKAIALKSEYSILSHGDCWSNNIMFLYENQNRQSPVDIKLIDWQMIRCTIPVFDLAFFFYTVASKETVGKLNYFLKIYHGELSKNMKMLGSDPNLIYPYTVLEEQWKEHGKYGFVMALITLLLMTADKDKELFSFEEVDLEHPETWKPHKKSNEYFKRLKILAEHLVVNDFL